MIIHCSICGREWLLSSSVSRVARITVIKSTIVSQDGCAPFGKAIVCAAMRKRIHLAFAILKSRLPFEPDYTVAFLTARGYLGLYSKRN